MAHGAVAPVLAGGDGVRVVVDAQGALVGGMPDATGGGARLVAVAVEASDA